MSETLQSIEKIDLGKNYGKHSPYLRKVIVEETKIQIQPLIKKIKGQEKTNAKITIADWGGGNALLGRELIKKLKKYKARIYNIDIDKTKFIKFRGIINIQADALTYKPKEKFDYSVCRNLLHYLDYKERIKLLKNIKRNTKKYFLLINWISSSKKYKEQHNKFFRKLRSLTGIYRYCMTKEEILNYLKIASFNILSCLEVEEKNFDWMTFNLTRYCLSEKKHEPLIELSKKIKEKVHVNLVCLCC